MHSIREEAQTHCSVTPTHLQPQHMQLTPNSGSAVHSTYRRSSEPSYRGDCRGAPRARYHNHHGGGSASERTSSRLSATSDAQRGLSSCLSSTLPIMGRGLHPRVPAERGTARAASAQRVAASTFPSASAHVTPRAADYASRHVALLVEEREAHRKSLDRAWQRQQVAEAALAKMEAAHQQTCCALRCDALHLAEALARSEIAREALEIRLDEERRFHRLRGACEGRTSAVTVPTTRTPARSAPHSRPSTATIPDKRTLPRDEAAAWCGDICGNERDANAPARASHESCPLQVHTRRGKSRLTSPLPHSSVTTEARTNGDGSPPPHAATSPLTLSRPMTGVVRDSDLLRQLRQAESRIRQLERRLSGCEQAEPLQEPYATLTNTLVMLDDADDEEEG